ncbi:transmembrane transport protein [Streptantibioticus cattleyicolor NRRL 8057 = DSM 46488]|uniref:Transmembrane transport protein n=1 Tax=Streptantibioticus cattleyicolor (strain ATCC 35852 / DSM 46488 / JCM 4925 / NBRC 14057 / NRRL 8057) TaxID=1003195 RepID=G8WZP7_STREN|nr:transmembrane transport protein [Streptantibioticus cattleyicolor NRRL 8057 = DSM 46488]
MLVAVAALVVAGCAVWVTWRRTGLVVAIDVQHLVPCRRSGGCADPRALDLLGRDRGPLAVLDRFTTVAVPVLVGVFWGAPLLGRELETGTYQVALAQGVGPVRWFATRFALAAGCAAVGSGALTALLEWWRAPLAVLGGGPPPGAGAVAVAVAGALFALAVGACAGLLLRGTLPAMACALVAVPGARQLLAAVGPAARPRTGAAFHGDFRPFPALATTAYLGAAVLLFIVTVHRLRRRFA